VGFRPSSTRLEGASCATALAYWPFGSPLRALRLGRSTPSPGHPRPRSPTWLAPRRTPSLALQSPTSFRPPGCPSSRVVSVTELAEPLRARPIDARGSPPARLVPIDLWRIGRAPDRPSPLRAKARCGPLVASPETLELVAQNPSRSPATGSTLARSSSPAGSCSVQRVALYWLPALPPRRLDDLGVFLVEPCRET
jgi:hypothetical protein